MPLAAANIFFSYIGYWFFAAELLKASIILPKLFTEAKQDCLLQDIQNNAQFPYSSKQKKETEEREQEAWNMTKLQASINNEVPYKMKLSETFNHFQKTILEFRSQLILIDKRINGAHVLMIIATAGLSIACQLNLYKYYAIGMAGLLLAASMVYLYATYTIWDMIQGLDHAYPKERLIHVKVISFFTYTVIMLSGYGMLLFIAMSGNVETQESYLNLLKFSYLYFMVSITCNLFTCYIVILMLYIIVQITSKEVNTELKDTILGRRVPQIVYINNLRLLKKSVEREKDKLAHDALKR